MFIRPACYCGWRATQQREELRERRDMAGLGNVFEADASNRTSERASERTNKEEIAWCGVSLMVAQGKIAKGGCPSTSQVAFFSLIEATKQGTFQVSIAKGRPTTYGADCSV